MKLPSNLQLVGRFGRAGESWGDIVARVAALLPDDPLLRDSLDSGTLIPGGQILRGAGNPKAVLFNSAVLEARAGENPSELAARISEWTSMGVGVGVNVTPLLDNNPTSLLDVATVVGASQDQLWRRGLRRTATMIVVDHDVAGQRELAWALRDRAELRHLNFGVRLSDYELQDFNRDPSDIGHHINGLLDVALATGNPGFIFTDRVNRSSADAPVSACNACAEAHLYANEAIPLASINLAEAVHGAVISEDKLTQATQAGVRLLDAAIDASAMPSVECGTEVSKGRRLGLGILGLDSAFRMLGLAYDSAEAVRVSARLARLIGAVAKREAAELKVSRCNPALKRRGLLAVAPTGGISALWGVSSGIEPTFGENLQTEFTNIVVQTGVLFKKYPHQMHWSWHVEHLAAWQAVVDGGISKTVNLPSEADLPTARKLIVQAWGSGAKAVSLYRDGSRPPALRAT